MRPPAASRSPATFVAGVAVGLLIIGVAFLCREHPTSGADSQPDRELVVRLSIPTQGPIDSEAHIAFVDANGTRLPSEWAPTVFLDVSEDRRATLHIEPEMIPDRAVGIYLASGTVAGTADLVEGDAVVMLQMRPASSIWIPVTFSSVKVLDKVDVEIIRVDGRRPPFRLLSSVDPGDVTGVLAVEGLFPGRYTVVLTLEDRRIEVGTYDVSATVRTECPPQSLM